MDEGVFFQGDILRDFPVPFFSEVVPIIKQSTDGGLSILDGGFSALEDDLDVLAGASIKRMHAMLISQTCDIQRRERIAICPVFPITTVPAKTLDAVKKRKVYYWFYLPELDGVLPESIVDLQSIFSIPKSMLQPHISSKILSLSDWGRQHLGWALQSYFARPIESK